MEEAAVIIQQWVIDNIEVLTSSHTLAAKQLAILIFTLQYWQKQAKTSILVCNMLGVTCDNVRNVNSNMASSMKN